MENQNPTTPNPSTGGGKGSLVGSIIVVIVILIGGGYLLLNRSANPSPLETATTTDEQVLDSSGQASFQTTEADDLSTLEAEANAIDTADLDQAVLNLDAAASASQ